MDKPNTIKWQMESRLPNGHIYERIKESLKSRDLDEQNPYYYIYWNDLKKNWLRLYLLGTFKTTNEDYINFINWLNNNYKNDDIYEIKTKEGTIKIPIPFFEDYKCFKAEFLDIIMPYISNGTLAEPYLEGPYEYNDVKINHGDTVLDLGANYGLFSSLALSRDCNVYAFEPTSRALEKYLKRIKNNYPNFKIRNEAVSNKSGLSCFYNLEGNPSSNGILEKKCDNVSMVPTVSIDDFVTQERLKKVDFIKADIEGAERLMLEGAKETLKEYAPNLAICYYHRLDDLKVLTNLIKETNPNYHIETQYRKIYAKVLKK